MCFLFCSNVCFLVSCLGNRGGVLGGYEFFMGDRGVLFVTIVFGNRYWRYQFISGNAPLKCWVGRLRIDATSYNKSLRKAPQAKEAWSRVFSRGLQDPEALDDVRNVNYDTLRLKGAVGHLCHVDVAEVFAFAQY